MVKIVSGPHERLRYIIYNHLKSLVDAPRPGNCRNWAGEVRAILISVGYNDVWYSETLNVPLKEFVCKLQQTLVDQFIQEWYVEINTKEKLRTYKLFKHVFCYEMYLSTIESVKQRMNFARLRVSSHSLEIEMGRYPPRRPVERRLCKQCGTGSIEDELHFTLICTKYKALREQSIPRYFWLRPDMLKFMELMVACDSNEKLCKQVARFISASVDARAQNEP